MTNEEKVCKAFLDTVKRYQDYNFIQSSGALYVSTKTFNILYNLEILIHKYNSFAIMYNFSRHIYKREMLKDSELELTDFQIVPMLTDEEFIIKEIIE